jgi:hypothetical protein
MTCGICESPGLGSAGFCPLSSALEAMLEYDFWCAFFCRREASRFDRLNALAE